WPTDGVWTLVIKANQGPDDAATAVIELGPQGEVASVRVPTTQRGSWTVSAPVSLADIDTALKARAEQLARREWFLLLVVACQAPLRGYAQVRGWCSPSVTSR